MSRENLLEMGEFYRKPGDMIPERDSDEKPRPKPRPRTSAGSSRKPASTSPKSNRLTTTNQSPLGSSSGKTNSGFFGDEDDIVVAVANRRSSGSTKGAWGGHRSDARSGRADTFVDVSSSDDSIASGTRRGDRRAPLSVLSAVEVHSFDRASLSQQSSPTTGGEEETSFRIEDETARNSHSQRPKPKPKPRSKSSLKSASETTSENDSRREKSNSSKQKVRSATSAMSAGASPGFASPKEDFLAVTMPENEIESVPFESTKSEAGDKALKPQLATSTSGFRGMMKKARNFLSTKSLSLSQSESRSNLDRTTSSVTVTAAVTGTAEPQQVEQVEMKSPEKEDQLPQAEPFLKEPELKSVVKKLKSRRRRQADAEESKSRVPSSMTVFEQGESLADILSSVNSTPLSTSSKRDQRRRESLTGLTKLLGVTIHGCDMLPADPNILHPIVKVTIVDQSGLYLKCSEAAGGTGWDEPASSATTKSKPKPKRGGKNNKNAQGDQDQEDSDDSEPKSTRKQTAMTATATEKRRAKSGTSEKMSVKLQRDSILPIMTQSFEINYQSPSFAPTWNELLVFEEPFERFMNVDDSAIFLFEIMDFLPMNHGMSQTTVRDLTRRPGWGSYHGNEPGWYKIAWAFLKPVAANGIRNVNRKLRLQLYKPEALSTSEKAFGAEVFCWWKTQKRAKLNATLYVTLKGIVPPSGAVASLRTLLSMRKEHLTQAILDSQLATTRTRKRKKKSGKVLERKRGSLNLQRPNWTRHEGQSCKVPNKALMSLPTSQVASLNLTVCGNVHAIKISPDGLKLAAGLDTDELHVVLVFEIPTGTLLKNLRGHHGLIYDIDWSSPIPNDQEDGGDPSRSTMDNNYLASASADSTVLVWKVAADESSNSSSSNHRQVKAFSHPSFVYCVKFHPTQPNLLATGCFDYIIRIWNLRENFETSESSPVHSISPIVLLDRHFSFVNAIAFQSSGEYLFSGDGEGALYKWKTGSHNLRKWRLERNIKMSEAGKHPINDIVVHPNGHRVLVQIRDSCLKMVDINSMLTLQTFTGLHNDKLQIRSAMSPCGNLVLSGSEDATLCIWDADTGRILEFITPENHPNCIVTSVHYHPFDHYVALGLSSTIGEPNPVMIYAHISPDPLPAPQNLSLSTVIHLKSTLHRQRRAIDSEAALELKRTVTFAPNRGDSTEKFIKIIKKLDTALKIGKSRNVSDRRLSNSMDDEGVVEAGELAIVAANAEILQKQNELLLTKNNNDHESPEKIRVTMTPASPISGTRFPPEIDWSVSSVTSQDSSAPPNPAPAPRPTVRTVSKAPGLSSPGKKAAVVSKPISSKGAALASVVAQTAVSTPESDSMLLGSGVGGSNISSKRETRRRQLQLQEEQIGASILGLSKMKSKP